MSDNILLYLEKFNLFEKLDISNKSEQSKKSSTMKYMKSDTIFVPEEPHNNIYFLKKGRIKISSYNKDGEEFIKTILKPGDMFGKLIYSPGSESNDYAFALEECIVYSMPVDNFEKLIQTDAGLSAEVMKFVGLRLQKLERRVERLSFKDSKSRLIEMILDFKEDFGKRVGDEYFIQQNLSHKELAALIATSRQTVTKLLNELREKDLIDFNRKKLIIRNYKGLKAELAKEVM